MMRRLLIPILLLLAISASAQFGLRLDYSNNSYPGWDPIFRSVSGNEKLLPSGFQVGIDYWTRLKDQRVEFYPTIFYSSAKTTTNIVEADRKYSLSSVGFVLNTHFYIFDFTGDCDCPVFKKTGGLFKKGFFLLVGPGASYATNTLDSPSNPNLKNSEINFNISVGAGLDIGINSFITVSPIIQYRYTPTVINWPGFSTLHNQQPNPGSSGDFSRISQLYGGLRLGIRLDGDQF